MWVLAIARHPRSSISSKTMSDSRDVVLFPGQGSQVAGMRATVERLRPDLLELVLDEMGADPFARIEDGTSHVQPAIFCASLAGWSQLRQDVQPLAMAGHSLGEIAALVAAGALDVGAGLRLVIERGRLMQHGAELAGDGGMVAVLGDGRDTVTEVAAAHGLVVANDNSPTQVVLSGPVAGLRVAEEDLQRKGLRTMPLAVPGAFHSPAMEPVVPDFRAVLEQVDFTPPRVPVFSCVTAEPFENPRDELARSLTSPVRWLEVMHGLRGLGATRFFETGPSSVLSRLARRTLEGVEAFAPVAQEPAVA